MIKQTVHNCVGTCSRTIELSYDTDTNKIVDCIVIGGCNGNLKGIRSLIINRDINEVHDLLKGTTCGPRKTSCPDQIACAIEELLAK